MILISGATGKIGSIVCEDLHKAGVPFRVLIRDKKNFPFPASDTIEIMIGDLNNEADVAAAMRGCDKAFLIMGNSPNQLPIEIQFSDIAQKAGVEHLVKISSIEASASAQSILPQQHFASEEHIRSLGMGFTFLRPNFYMQNMLLHAAQISIGGYFALPLGTASTAMVDTRDVGAAAAKILQNDGHNGHTYSLTGTQLLTFTDVAQRMTTVLGAPVEYVDQANEDYRAELEPFVGSKWQLDAVCELFAEIANGSLEKKTSHLEHILDRNPISIDDFIRDYSSMLENRKVSSAKNRTSS